MKYSTILKTVSFACALIPGQVLFAQLPEKVGGLITADRNAAIIAKAEGPHAAFSSIIDKTSSFYVPSEVNAFNYLNNRPNIPDVLSWEPNFALVSKSL